MEMLSPAKLVTLICQAQLFKRVGIFKSIVSLTAYLSVKLTNTAAGLTFGNSKYYYFQTNPRFTFHLDLSLKLQISKKETMSTLNVK